ASDAPSTLHRLVENEPLCRTPSGNLDEPLALCRCDCWVKPKLLLAHPEESEDRRHEPQPIPVDVELLRGNVPEPIKHS
ncbi:hypothetical protein C8A05DRAFT_20559, partial [Staphylotrichum tortipilum]